MSITAVIPAAGFGTRFLPFTKAVPKEMVPLFNKPAIHYIAQEIYASALKKCIIITSSYKHAIENYFSSNLLLEEFLNKKNKLSLIADIENLRHSLSFNYIIQEQALGLGHAVGLAQSFITQDYFAVLLPDDIIFGNKPGIAQLIEIAQQEQATVIAIQEVAAEHLSSYGVIGVDKQYSSRLFQVKSVIEKPTRAQAPSSYAIIGRYVLPSHIFKVLATLKPRSNGEIQLTDALSLLIQSGHKVLAYLIEGTRYDVGTPDGWFQANYNLFTTLNT